MEYVGTDTGTLNPDPWPAGPARRRRTPPRPCPGPGRGPGDAGALLHRVPRLPALGTADHRPGQSRGPRLLDVRATRHPHDFAFVKGPNGSCTISPTSSATGTRSCTPATSSPWTTCRSTSARPATASPGARRSTSSTRPATATRCSAAGTSPAPTSRRSPGPPTSSARGSSTSQRELNDRFPPSSLIQTTVGTRSAQFMRPEGETHG